MHRKQIAIAVFAAGCLAASAAAQQNNSADSAGGYESLGAASSLPTAAKQQMAGPAGVGQVQIDPAALQQVVDQINKTATSQQIANKPDQAALQQQMQAQMNTTSSAMQQQMVGKMQNGQMAADPAIQQGMAKKMEEVMRQGRADSTVIQDMQKKIMTEQMQKNMLQESIKPMMMENVQKQITGSSTATP
jgi:hypothetical protein